MKRLYKNFIFDIVVAVIALALGIIMLPPFGIGQKALNILLAVTLVAYLVIHLFDKLRRSRGTTFILTLIEFSVISLIALGLVLQQFNVFNLFGVCRVLGVVMWLRGVTSLVVMYITLATVKVGKYNLPKFIIYILISTLGVYLFANPLITDLVFNWIICIFMFIACLAFAGLAVLYSPAKAKN